MSGHVAVDTPAPGVVRIRIVHPDHRGALSAPVLAGLERALAEVPADARCLILASAGEAFSAGYDIRALAEPPDPGHAEATIAPERVAVLDMLERQPLPVVAAVNGPALGGGLELVLACDIRIAAETATFGAPAGKLGLVYSPGGLERIARELPPGVAAELFLAAGELPAARARELGLIADVVSPEALDAAALDAAVRIAALAPASARAHRAALRARVAAAPGLPDPARSTLAQARAAGLASADFAEGVAAFVAHRTPRFTGRTTAA